MLSSHLILLLLVSTTFSVANAESREKRATGLFSTFLVPIARFSELLTGPLAGIVQSLPIVGPILAPNGTILGFNFGGIIISTSAQLDAVLAPIFGGLGSLANGLGGSATTTGAPIEPITTPASATTASTPAA